MKILQLPIKIFLILSWLTLATEPVRSQSGNMSDITLPSPDAMVTEPPTEEAPIGDSEPAAEAPTEEVTAGDGEPVVEDLVETVTEEVTVDDSQPVGEDVTEPVAEEVTEPVAEDVTEPVGEDVTVGDSEPVAEDVTEPVAEEVTEPVAEEVTEPVAEDVTEPVAEDVTEPVAEEVTEPVAEDVTEPVAEDVTEPVAEDVTEPVAEDVTEPVAEEVTEPVAEEVTEPVAEDVTEPTGETLTEETAVGESNSDIDLRENTAGDLVDTSEDNTLEVVEESPNTDLDSTSSTNENLDSDDDTVSDSIVDTEEGSADVGDRLEDSNSDGDVVEATDSLDSQLNDAESEVVELEEADAEIASPAEVEDTIESDTVEEVEPDSDVAEIEAEDSSLEPEEVAEEAIPEEEEPTEEVIPEEEATEEVIEEEEATEESSSEEEEVAKKKNSEAEVRQLDRVAYEAQVQEAPNDVAIQMQEEFQSTQLIDSSGLQLYGTVPSVKDISGRLAQLAEQTGKKPAFINISLQQNQLESFVVLPDRTLTANKNNNAVASSDLKKIDSQSKPLTLRKTIKDTSRKELMAIATQFREEVSDGRNLGENGYLESAQELYRVLIEPIEAELEANGIDILVFSMDSGLRLLPLAALHDGEQFLVEKYAMGIVPSFGLTDTRYVNLSQSPILAMGASEFEEQEALPTVALELETVVRNPRQGEAFLNKEFTIANFIAQNSREIPFPIVHLGTHAEFNAGELSDSYIQFYDDKLKIPQLQQLSDELGWNTDASPVELLVLSACETALGNEDAELGFAGLAVQAGVKSALASLWYVSDLGTLALMGEFYDRLETSLVKAEALRQTQLAMLQGDVEVDNGQITLSNGEKLSLPEDFPDGNLSLSHPYFWSSFTLIGNWN